MTLIVITAGTGWEGENAKFMMAVPQSLEECYGTDNHEKITKMVYELRNKYVRSKGRKLQHEVLDPTEYAEPYCYWEIFDPEFHRGITFDCLPE